MKSNNYKLGCIIYSRMKSSRFPGKAKFKLNGISLLERVIKRTKLIKNKPQIILATSIDSSDDCLCEIAKKNDIFFYRGSLENVFERTKDILLKFKLDYFARICGDRPLLDPFLYDLAFKQSLNNKLDLCTTLNPKILPAGLTAEIISTSSFLAIANDKISDFNKEHITSKYYENTNEYKIENLILPRGIAWKDFEKISYTLDEIKDIDFLIFNIKNLKNVKFGIKYHLRLQKIASNWNKMQMI